mmetsp:Transcript_45617/g.67262  ORF Transcript_45617/g.67262 Transcript_45617/m.67262 type:complete len:180 (-) Transcript_45617:31-570(-)
MSDGDNVITQGFPVLKQHVPFIIGAKGRNIDHISSACGATLSIERGEDAGNVTFNREWTYVRITGKGYQVDRAKKLLLIHTIEATQLDARGPGSNDRSGGGGRGGSGNNNNDSEGGRGRGRGRNRSRNNNRNNNNDNNDNNDNDNGGGNSGNDKGNNSSKRNSRRRNKNRSARSNDQQQ